jgi:hypothetical protein
VLAGLVSCKKGGSMVDSIETPAFLSRTSNIPVEEIDANHVSTSGKMTVLGIQYKHPFGIANMRKAFHNLYPKLTKNYLFLIFIFVFYLNLLRI